MASRTTLENAVRRSTRSASSAMARSRLITISSPSVTPAAKVRGGSRRHFHDEFAGLCERHRSRRSHHVGGVVSLDHQGTMETFLGLELVETDHLGFEPVIPFVEPHTPRARRPVGRADHFGGVGRDFRLGALRLEPTGADLHLPLMMDAVAAPVGGFEGRLKAAWFEF